MSSGVVFSTVWAVLSRRSFSALKIVPSRMVSRMMLTRSRYRQASFMTVSPWMYVAMLSRIMRVSRVVRRRRSESVLRMYAESRVVTVRSTGM